MFSAPISESKKKYKINSKLSWNKLRKTNNPLRELIDNAKAGSFEHGIAIINRPELKSAKTGCILK